jgi:hypothetical protein
MSSRLIRTCMVCSPGLSVAGEHQKDMERERCHPDWARGGLVPFGIIVKVKSCKGQESFGIQISRR